MLSGKRDTTFNNPQVVGEAPTCLAVQTDGKVLVGINGATTVAGVSARGIHRLNEDGTVDATWTVVSPDGAGYPSAVLVLPSGKVVVAGAGLQYSGVHRAVAILNADGTLDTGVPALQATRGAGVMVSALRRDASGNLWLAGLFDAVSGHATSNIAKLTSTGALDTSFAAPTFDNYCLDVCPLADGSVLAGGLFTTVDGQARGAVCRLTASGALHAPFPNLAPVITGGGVTPRVGSIQLRSDGTAVLSGYFDSIGGQALTFKSLCRVNTATGAVTPNWPQQPKSTGSVGRIALDAQDRLYLADGNPDSPYTICRRLLADGSAYDPEFNAPFGSGGDWPHYDTGAVAAYFVVPTSDKRVVLGGTFHWIDDVETAGVARILSDPGDGRNPLGMRDYGFTSPSKSRLIGVLPGLRTVVSSAPDSYDLTVLGPYGAVEATWPVVGGSAMFLTTLPDGRILVGGSFTEFNGIPRPRLVCLTASGTLDPTFPAHAIPSGTVKDIKRDASGNIWLAGSFLEIDGHTTKNAAKLTSTGALDTSFAAPVDGGGSNAIIPLPSGAVILAGGGYNDGTHNTQGLYRLTATGSFDPAFIVPALANSGWEGQYNIYAAALFSNGDLIAVGTFPMYGSANLGTYSNIVRISSATAALVSTWPEMSMFGGPTLTGIRHVRVDSQDRVYIGARRMLEDGTYDPHHWDATISLQDSMFGLALDDDRVLINAGSGSSDAWLHRFWAEVPPPGIGAGTIRLRHLPAAVGSGTIALRQHHPISEAGFGSGVIALRAGTAIGGKPRPSSIGPGDIDASWNLAGTEVNGESGVTSPIVLLLPDGRMLVSGKGAGAPDGVYLIDDAGMLVAGWTVTPSDVTNKFPRALLSLPNGKIAISDYAPATMVFGGVNRLVALLNSDGTLDTAPPAMSITADGPSGPNGPADGMEMCLLSDGSFLVLGKFDAINGHATSDVAKVTASGALDTSFSIATTPALFSSRILGFRKDVAGNVWLFGRFSTINGHTTHNIAKLSSTGVLDTSFSGVVKGGSSNTYHNALPLPDGTVLVAADSAGLYRLSATGASLQQLLFTFASGQTIDTLYLRGDGKVVIEGYISAVEGAPTKWGRFCLLDPATWTVSTAWPATDEYPGRPYCFDAQDRMYSGKLTSAKTFRRVNTNGTDDYTFRRSDDDRVRFVHLDGAGRIILSGLGSAGGGDPSIHGIPYNSVARIWADVPDGRAPVGMPDFGFAPDPVGYDLLCVLPGHKVLVRHQAQGHVLRLDDRGAQDASFLLGVPDDAVYCAVGLPDGRILVGGSFTEFNGIPRPRLVCLTASGTLDPTFPAHAIPSGTVKDIKRDASGNIWLAGTFTSVGGHATTCAAKLLSTGAVDTTFAAPSAGSGVNRLLVLADGAVLLIGGTYDDGVTQRSKVYRVSATGAFQPGFNIATSGFFDAKDGPVHDAAQFSDGSVVVVGSFFRGAINIGAPGVAQIIPTNGGWHSSRWPNSMSWSGDITSEFPRNADYHRIVIDALDRVYLGGGSRYLRVVDSDRGQQDLSYQRVAFTRDATGLALDGDRVVMSAAGPGSLKRVWTEVPAPATGSGALVLRLFRGMPPGYGAGTILLKQHYPPVPPGIGHGTIHLTGSGFAPGVLPMANGYGKLLLTGHASELLIEKGIVADRMVLNAQPDTLPIAVLRELLALTGAPVPQNFEGAAAVNDAIVFESPVAFTLLLAIEEGLVLGGGAVGGYTAFARVVSRMLLSEVATGYAEAVAQILDALVLAALAEGLHKGEAAETLLLGENIAAHYTAFASVLETLLLGAAAVPSYLAVALVEERLLLGSEASHAADLAVLVRDSIGFVATLSIDNGEYIAWVLNTQSKGLSRYTNYPFNSFARIGDRYYGAASDGLHRLEGDDDNGTPIAARIRAGLSALGSRRLKRMPEAFIGYRSDGTLLLWVVQVNEDTGEKEAGIFKLQPRPAANTRENRFKPGRGFKAVDFDFILENVDGADFDLTAIEFRPLMLDRRTRG